MPSRPPFRHPTKVLLVDDEALVATAVRAALADLRGQALAFLAGASLWWGLLAFLVGWLDRLSRGYMTARLSAIGVALGVSVPSLAFLL